MLAGELARTGTVEDGSSGDREHRRPEPGVFTSEALAALRVLAAGITGGLVCGAVIGGAGGRLAMFLLRLTSDPAVRLLETDDGFGIGSFTLDTVFLVLLTTVAGLIGGVAYLGMRRWLPTKHRGAYTGVIAAAVGGALFIEPGGVDFTVLDPLWLAVALFVALPAFYGVAVSWLVERLLAEGSLFNRLGPWGAAPVLIVVVAGPLVAVLVVVGAGWWIVRRYPKMERLWQSDIVTWLGRVALIAVTVFATAQLAQDISDILS